MSHGLILSVSLHHQSSLHCKTQYLHPGTRLHELHESQFRKITSISSVPHTQTLSQPALKKSDYVLTKKTAGDVMGTSPSSSSSCESGAGVRWLNINLWLTKSRWGENQVTKAAEMLKLQFLSWPPGWVSIDSHVKRPHLANIHSTLAFKLSLLPLFSTVCLQVIQYSNSVN